jgi:hypothetical protein
VAGMSGKAKIILWNPNSSMRSMAWMKKRGFPLGNLFFHGIIADRCRVSQKRQLGLMLNITVLVVMFCAKTEKEQLFRAFRFDNKLA